MSSVTQPQVALVGIRAEPLSIDEVIAAVQHPRAGAVGLFVGQVRDHDHGQGVTALDYSAHPSAADRVAEIAADLLASVGADRGVLRAAVVHRVGALGIGDLAIVAAVSAEHRAEAITTCHALVDRVKAEVPIWKHQRFADGSDEWVGMP